MQTCKTQALITEDELLAQPFRTWYHLEVQVVGPTKLSYACSSYFTQVRPYTRCTY